MRGDDRLGDSAPSGGESGRRATARLGDGLPPIPRLGVATRGNTVLEADDVHYALERGVRYFNWCRRPDGLSRAMREVGSLRREIVLAAQIKARTASEAEREMDWILEETGSARLEVGTLYYVESDEEWRRLTGPGGAWESLAKRRRAGQLGKIGLTSHQRTLAAKWAQERGPDGRLLLDLLMIRYNAAHTGAEKEVFPVTTALGMPVVTFTALRWRDLLRATPDDPPGFRPPSAAECYHFCLAQEAIAVVLAAPNGRAELEEDLHALDKDGAPGAARMQELRRHGERVHRHCREFW